MKGETYVDVPHTLGDIIGSRTRTSLGCVTASQVVPLLRLEVPDGA